MIQNINLDGHKLYWHLDRVKDWQKDRLISPIYLEISPTSTCNHRCVFCGIDFVRNKGTSLDATVLIDTFPEMADAGVKSIMYAGEGEPLLHPQIASMIAGAKSSGIDVALVTNGSVGDDQLWEDILPNLTWVRFSIDSATAQTHASIHQVSLNEFDRVIATVKRAVAAKKRLDLKVTIGVQFLVMERNVADILPAIELYSSLNVDYLSLKPYSLHPQMLLKTDEVYTPELVANIDRVVKQISENKPEMKVIFRKDAMTSYMNNDMSYNHCYALPFWGYIDSSGDFYTCSVYLNDERFCVGNVGVDSITEILFGERRRKSIEYAEKELNVHGECRLNCRMARVNEFLEFLENKPQHVNFI